MFRFNRTEIKMRSNKLMDPVYRTDLAVLAMWQQHGVIEVYNRFVCVVLVMKKSRANLTECQCQDQHQRVGLMEEGSVHDINLAKPGRLFKTVCKMLSGLLLSEFVFIE